MIIEVGLPDDGWTQEVPPSRTSSILGWTFLGVFLELMKSFKVDSAFLLHSKVEIFSSHTSTRGNEYCDSQLCDRSPVQVEAWEESHPLAGQSPGCGAARGSKSLLVVWPWGRRSSRGLWPPVENGGGTKYAFVVDGRFSYWNIREHPLPVGCHGDLGASREDRCCECWGSWLWSAGWRPGPAFSGHGFPRDMAVVWCNPISRYFRAYKDCHL